MTVEYFAYGSNMHPARLAERVGPAEIVATASAPGFRLAFHKRGRDGSGKCDMRHTGRPGDCVYGVVYRIGRGQKRVLDALEGVGRGYLTTALTVTAPGREYHVHSYVAEDDHIDPALPPFDWYKALVLEAARRHGFPPAYVSGIEQVPDVPDPDAERALRHRRLLEEVTWWHAGAFAR